MAASLGEDPDDVGTALDLLVHALGGGELICAQCSLGKSMQARTSSREASIITPGRSFVQVALPLSTVSPTGAAQAPAVIWRSPHAMS